MASTDASTSPQTYLILYKILTKTGKLSEATNPQEGFQKQSLNSLCSLRLYSGFMPSCKSGSVPQARGTILLKFTYVPFFS